MVEKFMNKVEEALLDYGYEDVLIFENPSYETAFIGVTNDNRAVYNYDDMLEYLVEEGMELDMAADYICYNSSFYTEGMPLIVYPVEIE